MESARPAAAVCRANARTLGVADRVQVITVPVERYLGRSAPAAGFDLVLADPPYDVVDLDGVLEALARDWLAARAVVVLERGARAADVHWPGPLTPMDVRRYGDSVLWFARSD